MGTGDRRTDEVDPLFSRLLSSSHMHITARQAYTCARYVSSLCMGCGLVYAVCLCVCVSARGGVKGGRTGSEPCLWVGNNFNTYSAYTEYIVRSIVDYLLRSGWSGLVLCMHDSA